MLLILVTLLHVSHANAVVWNKRFTRIHTNKIFISHIALMVSLIAYLLKCDVRVRACGQ
jgi:hypothetical protein